MSTSAANMKMEAYQAILRKYTSKDPGDEESSDGSSDDDGPDVSISQSMV